MHLLACRVLLVLLPVFLVWDSSQARAVSFNAYWQHRARGGDDLDTRHFFQQRYGLGAGTGLRFQPTPAISAGANLTYTRTEIDTGDGLATSEHLAPFGTIGVTNDIFHAGLSGTAAESRHSQRPTRTSDNWEATLASNWNKYLWPNLRLNYGQEGTGTKERGTDARGERHGFGLDWDLLLAKFFYNFNNSRSENLVGMTESESRNHFARAETSRRFLQNRIDMRLAQHYRRSTSEFTALNPELGVFVPAPVEGIIAGDVLDQADCEAQPEEFDPSGGLPLSINLGQCGQLAVRFNIPQQVDELHFLLDLTHLTPSQAGENLEWNLYVRDAESLEEDPWSLAAEAIQVVPVDDPVNDPADFTTGWFKLEIGQLVPEPVRQIKVVLSNAVFVSPLIINEFEAVRILTANESAVSRQTAHLTSARLQIRLSPTLTAASRMTLEKIDSQAGETDHDFTQHSLSSSLRWSPSPYVVPSLGFSETRQEGTGVPEAIGRSYTLSVATFPLPTLNVNLGATRFDRFVDGRRTSTRDTYGLTSTAKLYPDLTAAFNASFSTSNIERADGTIVVTDSLGSRLALNARLNPKLTADLTGSYLQSETAVTSYSVLDSSFALAYRPSDLLSMRLLGTKRWSGHDIPDTLDYSMNLALLRTHKARVALRYNQRRSTQTIHGLGLAGSWDINRNLVLQSRFNYTSAASDNWSILTSLALRL